MKLNHTNVKENLDVYFDDLDIGTLFENNGYYYIKTNIAEDIDDVWHDYNAVNIETGYHTHIDGNDNVTFYNGSIELDHSQFKGNPFMG